MKPISHCLLIALAVSMAVLPMAQATGIHYHAKKLGRSIGHVAKAGIVLHMLAAKKALLFGLPIAAAKGAFILGTAKAGALIGAPLGAIAGAKVGAAAGAIKGAALGKGLLIAKKAMAIKALKVAKVLALKPIVLAAGLKAALLAKKAALVGHGLSLVGKGMMLKGKALTAKGAKIASISAKIKALKAAAKAKLAAALVLPAIKGAKLAKAPLLVYTGPKYANVAWNMAHPLTGFRYGQASFGGLRKKRDTESEISENYQRPVSELITIVQSRTARACLAKVICELSADSQFHGQDGVKFANTLQALGRANLPRAEHFRSASAAGSRLREPSLCALSYTDCSTPSSEVIKIGNALISG